MKKFLKFLGIILLILLIAIGVCGYLIFDYLKKSAADQVYDDLTPVTAERGFYDFVKMSDDNKKIIIDAPNSYILSRYMDINALNDYLSRYDARITKAGIRTVDDSTIRLYVNIRYRDLIDIPLKADFNYALDNISAHITFKSMNIGEHVTYSSEGLNIFNKLKFTQNQINEKTTIRIEDYIFREITIEYPQIDTLLRMNADYIQNVKDDGKLHIEYNMYDQMYRWVMVEHFGAGNGQAWAVSKLRELLNEEYFEDYYKKTIDNYFNK